MDIPIYWVIDRESDTGVGSTHTWKSAKAMAVDHDAATHHHSRIRRVMMDEARTHRDVPL